MLGTQEKFAFFSQASSMDRKILSYRGAKRVFTLIACLTLLQGLCLIVQAIFLAEVVTHLFDGKSVQDEVRQMLLFFSAFAGRYFCVFLIQTISERFAERTSSDLSSHFLAKLFKLGPKFAANEGTGNLVTLVMEGVGQARQYLQLFPPKMVSNVVLPVMILCYVFTLDRLSAVILAVAMPVLIVFMVLLGLAAQKKMNDRWTSYRVLSNHFIDSLRGLSTLRYLGLSRHHAESIRRVSDKYRKMTMRTLSLAFMSSFALDFFSMLSIAFVAVALGLRLINGQITLFPALTVLILAPEFFLPVRELGQDYHATLDGKEAAHKLLAYSDQEKDDERLAHQKAFPEQRWNQDSSLEICNCTYVYPSGTRSALSSIQVEARGFTKIGIVGASGAGKSTLIDLIGGFISAESGIIRVNNQPTVLNQEDWRKQITYIPQHPYLFSGSLKDNITFYSPESTDEEVMQAIEKAGLHALVSKMNHGLEERIGAGGRQLSGGQEQRIALARAYLCNRPILLLDEPTAHLDIETEYELKETMIELFKGKLVFLATHRLHWMDQMDEMIVMANGKITEYGTPTELVRKNGFYATLVRTQLEGL